MGKIAVAAGIAVAAAAVVAIPEIAGIATWKFVLALVGLAIYVTASRR